MNLVRGYHFFQLYFLFPILLGSSFYMLFSGNGMVCKVECENCNFVVDECKRINPVVRNGTQHQFPVDNKSSNVLLISDKINHPRTRAHFRKENSEDSVEYSEKKKYYPKALAIHLLGLCVIMFIQFGLLRGFGKFFVFKFSAELNNISCIPDKRKQKYYMLILADWTYKYFIRSGYIMCFLECFALVTFAGQLQLMQIFSGVRIESLARSFQLAFQSEAQRWNRVDPMYDSFPELVSCNGSKIVTRIIDNTTAELITSPTTAYCFISTNKSFEIFYLMLVLWTMITSGYFFFRIIKNMIFFPTLTTMPYLRSFYISRILLTRFPFVGVSLINYKEKGELFRSIGPGQIHFLNEVKQQVGFNTFKSFMEVYFNALWIDFLAQRARLDENMNERLGDVI